MNESAHRVAIIVGLIVALLAVAGPALLVVRARESRAEFGDSEAVGTNHLGAATIDVEIGERSATLSVSNMAPGDTAIGWLDLRNEGDLALRYSVVTDNDDDLLLDHLRWDLWTTPTGCTTSPPVAARLVDQARLSAGTRVALLGSSAIGADPGDRTLGAGEGERLCIAATLPFDAPNEVQGRTVGQTVHVIAEQAPDEAP